MRAAHFIFYLGLLLLPACAALALFSRGPAGWLAGFVYILYDTVLLMFVIFRILQTRPPPDVSADRGPSLGVLIAARNESSVILACLEKLFAQVEAANSVYLVDDGSTDSTVTLVENAFPQVKIWRKEHSGKADSLNRVWPTMQEEVIVTLDADTLLKPGALQAFRRAFAAHPNLAAAGGILTPTCLHPGWLAGPFQTFQRFEYVRAFLSRRAWMQSGALLLVSGAFGAYRKSALAEVGGYDTNSLVEDYDLIHRIHRYAFEHAVVREVAVLASARAVTDAPNNFGAFLRQRQRWFAGFLQTHFHNWDMVGNCRYGSVGRWMLPIKSLDTLQPLYGIVAFITLVYLVAVQGQVPPLILAVVLCKIAFDLGFHFWSVSLYCGWQRERPSARMWWQAALVSVVEPFSFQLLRHCGAALGWMALLAKNHAWTPHKLASSGLAIKEKSDNESALRSPSSPSGCPQEKA